MECEHDRRGAPAGHLTGLTQRSGNHAAVDGIDLNVPAGKFYGILWPDGAGKPTTLAMIADLLAPTSDFVQVAGFDARKDREQVLGVLRIMMEGLSLP